MTNESKSRWQEAHRKYLERINKLRAEPGPVALLRRALIELRSFERDVEAVISDDELANDIEAYLAEIKAVDP